MLVNRIEGATRNLGKPTDWDDSKGNCVSLPIRDEVLAGGIPCMVSSWQPTPEEAERIAAGAPVWLRIVGVSHPPVSLEVSAPPSVSDEHSQSEDAVAAEGEACQRGPEGDTPNRTPKNPPPTGEGQDLVERLKSASRLFFATDWKNTIYPYLFEEAASRITTLEGERDEARAQFMSAVRNNGIHRSRIASLTTTLEELRRAVGEAASLKQARDWLRNRWGQEHPNEGHVRMLADYAAFALHQPNKEGGDHV